MPPQLTLARKTNKCRLASTRFSEKKSFLQYNLIIIEKQYLMNKRHVCSILFTNVVCYCEILQNQILYKNYTVYTTWHSRALRL